MDKSWKHLDAYFETEVEGKPYEFLTIKAYKRLNPYFKRDYIEAISHHCCIEIEEAIQDYKRSGIPTGMVAECIMETVGVHHIIVLTDFMNPFPITATLARELVSIHLFVNQIKYCKEENPKPGDFVLDRNLYQSFDWHSAIKNNYKFQIAHV